MPAAGAIRAGRAEVEIGANLGPLRRGLQRVQATVALWGSALKSGGLRVLGAVTAVATPLGFAVKRLIDLDDELRKVAAVSGATEAEFGALTETAERLGRETSFTAAEVAQGMRFLGMAGYNVQQILAGIPHVLNLARAGALDLGAASDIATDIATAFGLSADQIGRVADVLTKTATSSNTDVLMVGEAMKYAGAVAATAGQSLEEIAAAMGVLAGAGVKASMAGTSLRGMLIKMANDGRQKLAQLGVAVEDAAGNTRPLMDVIQDLGRRTAGLSELERVGVFADIFGQRAVTAALAIANAGGAVDAFRQKITQSTGTAARVAAEMDAGIGGAFRRLASAIEGAAIKIARAVEPMVTQWATALRGVAGWIARVAAKNPELFRTLARGLAIAAAVGAAMVGLGLALQMVSFALGGLKLPLAIASVGLRGLALTFGLFKVVPAILGTVVTAVRGVGLAMMALGGGPVGLLIAAAATVGAVWIATTTDWRSALTSAGETVRTVAAQAQSVWQAAIATLRESWSAFAAAIAAGEVGAAMGVVAATAKLAWTKAATAIYAVWANVSDAILALWTEGSVWLQRVGVNAWFGIQKVAQQVATAVLSAWITVTTYLKAAWIGIAGAIREAWAWVTGGDTEAIRRQTDAAVAELADQMQRKLAAVGGGEKDVLAAIEKQRQAALAEIERRRQEAHVKHGQRYRDMLQQAQQQLDQARQNWREAVQRAREAAKSAEEKATKEKESDEAGENVAERQRKAYERGALGLRRAEQVAIAGTFNAAVAARSLGSPRTVDRIAVATEATAVNTKQIADNLGGVFT